MIKAVSIDLALQGGGSHGAFTWGVLDRLLDDEGIVFDGISGTSAGALNAAVMASGYAQDGRQGARRALRDFWLDVAAQQTAWGSCFGDWSALTPRPPGVAGLNLDSNPFYQFGNQFLRAFSPYQFGATGFNPLRAVLLRHVRPALLAGGPLALFVTATSVRSGLPRVFSGEQLSVDALLASACLPHLFRAVEIEGEPYWDGGYSGNPALWPLIYKTRALDIVLVKINPLHRSELPETPAEIADRVNEITFNAGLIAELRAIGFVQKLVAQGSVQPGNYKNLRLHMVADEDGLAPLHPSSKLNTERRFLELLRDMGRAAAERWLVQHRSALGRHSTLDLQGFLDG